MSKKKPQKSKKPSSHSEQKSEKTSSHSEQTPFETDYQRDTRKSEELLQLGVSAKRSGQYLEAKRLYESAVKIAPWYLHSYYALGKINYLLGEQSEAVINYCTAAHLHLGLWPSLDQKDGMFLRKISTSAYPKSLINALKQMHPHADLLIADDNTPRHLGHALIDLSSNDEHSTSIKAAARAYKESIAGSGRGFLIQMDAELEQELYFSIGVVYLWQHLRWDKIGKCPAEEVSELYRQLSMSSSSDKVYEIELRGIFEKLSKSMSLQSLASSTPFAELVREINEVLNKSSGDSLQNLKNYASQSCQAIEQLLARPLHSTINSLLFGFNKSIAFRSSIVNRWKDTVGLLQTPVIDFLFKVGKAAPSVGVTTPTLNAVLQVLSCKEIVDLRNGLTHSCYSWSGDEENCKIHIMERRVLGTDKEVVRVLQADICEAFHSLVCICLSAIRRVSTNMLEEKAAPVSPKIDTKDPEQISSSLHSKNSKVHQESKTQSYSTVMNWTSIPGVRSCVDCNRPTGNWCDGCEAEGVADYPPFPNRPFCTKCEDSNSVCKFCRTKSP